MTARRSSTDDAADPLVDQYAVSTDASEAEFLAAAKLYARAVAERHDLSVDVTGLEWSLSKRAKRRAGAVKHDGSDPHAVVLTWDHFLECGWRAAAATVRHELVHVHLLVEEDEPGHGTAFTDLADRLDAPRHCERFSDPAWWVVCTDCDSRLARYRRSKLVEEPGSYRCGDCGGTFRVEPAD